MEADISKLAQDLNAARLCRRRNWGGGPFTSMQKQVQWQAYWLQLKHHVFDFKTTLGYC